MNRPPLHCFIIGHGLVLGSAIAGMLLAIILWAAAAVPAAVPVVAVAVALSAGRARDRISRYRAWHREWAALAPSQGEAPSGTPTEAESAPQVRTPRHRVLWVMVIGSWFYLAAIAKTRDQQALVGLMTLLIVGYFGVALIARLLRKKAPASKSERRLSPDDTLVSQCITHSLYAVPSLGAAYQHLPGYCLQTLQMRGE